MATLICKIFSAIGVSIYYCEYITVNDMICMLAIIRVVFMNYRFTHTARLSLSIFM